MAYRFSCCGRRARTRLCRENKGTIIFRHCTGFLSGARAVFSLSRALRSGGSGRQGILRRGRKALSGSLVDKKRRFAEYSVCFCFRMFIFDIGTLGEPCPAGFCLGRVRRGRGSRERLMELRTARDIPVWNPTRPDVRSLRAFFVRSRVNGRRRGGRRAVTAGRMLFRSSS